MELAAYLLSHFSKPVSRVPDHIGQIEGAEMKLNSATGNARDVE